MKKYDDIINLPHHASTRHPHMPMIDRAAQFSPFKAMVGHDAAVNETARLTDSKVDLSEDAMSYLSEQLNLLQSRLDESPTASITYFVPDNRKAGGEYVTVSGEVKKIDEFERVIVMRDGMRIPIEDIMEIV